MKSKRQKRIAIVNDMAGFGRCSIAVAQPIISAMKIQCCPLPTAILSSSTAFSGFFFEDYTEKMKPIMKHWKELNLEFDGIYTGFLGSKEQIDVVIDFIKMFKKTGTKAVIDPVMGDDGVLYSTYTPQMCEEMKKLVRYADVLTPNLTEACRLLDMPYPKETPSNEELKRMGRSLCKMGPEKIVITGLKSENHIFNFTYEKGLGSMIIKGKRIGDQRAGTGDVFSSIIAASVVNGEDLKRAVRKASKFIEKAMVYTMKLQIPKDEGICFEEFLSKLK